ncbi:hypothetical protein P5673_013067 [Acropora cervicornis]|uniref:Uncharacterized protein n=1 Tax=Acropora cervicornis TaxID=6130 RepID=A0AAD9V7A9_ACRCE|nr:hypothetical protein P5673_013067 [Acropora cervicornis]
MRIFIKSNFWHPQRSRIRLSGRDNGIACSQAEEMMGERYGKVKISLPPYLSGGPVVGAGTFINLF